jgi:hypothetical protein
MSCSPTDSFGRSLLDNGLWTGNTTLQTLGGQVMHFAVTNENLIGTTITLADGDGETRNAVLGPQQTIDFEFSTFAQSPISWSFSISTDSDVFIVSWCLYSTWRPSAPVVTSVQPSSGIPGDSVTVEGAGFTLANSIYFDNAVAPIVSVTETRLDTVAPIGVGTVTVIVSNSLGLSPATPACQFTYRPTPIVSSVNPSQGSPGDTVTIIGAGFGGATDIAFGLVEVAPLNSSDTALVVQAPEGGGTVDIVVTTPAGSSPEGPASKFIYI